MSIAAHITSVVFTDVGAIDIPEPTATALASAPRRKNGEFDRRFRAAKDAERWVSDVKVLAYSRWEIGEDLTSEELPPI